MQSIDSTHGCSQHCFALDKQQINSHLGRKEETTQESQRRTTKKNLQLCQYVFFPFQIRKLLSQIPCLPLILAPINQAMKHVRYKVHEKDGAAVWLWRTNGRWGTHKGPKGGWAKKSQCHSSPKESASCSEGCLMISPTCPHSCCATHR